MNKHERSEADFETLAHLSIALREQHIARTDFLWEGSPFEWIRNEPSRRRGKIGEQLIEGWCVEMGLAVESSPDSDCDLLVGGRRVEVKFSTLWENGLVVFQQIRNQDYHFMICLGVTPNDARLWIIPKYELFSQPEGISPQHGGSAGRDTLWMRVSFINPPRWLSAYGGTLREGTEMLLDFLQS